MNYKLSEIAAVVGGKFTGCDAEVRSVVTDSRSLSCELGCCPMFVAMRGANHDSRGFVAQMSARGVRAFLVERDVECPADCGFVRVDNAIDALQRLAAHYRAQFRGTVVGITGSNGKTVIKEWIAEELPEGMKYYRSPKSYNSQLGVPLSVLMIEGDEQLALIEAGISKPGEMARLERIIRPDVVVFTSIGDAHQENFLNLEQKCDEKMVLAHRAETIVYHSYYEPLGRMIASRFAGRKLCDAASCPEVPETLIGNEASRRNARIVEAFCAAMGYPAPSFTEAPEVAMRLEVKDGINDSVLINDAYNLDLNSLALALDYLHNVALSRRRTLVLSDIAQSGLTDDELYGRVAGMVARAGVDTLVGIGPKLKRYAALFGCDKEFYASTDECIARIGRRAVAGRAVLLKGAREYRFEKLAHALAQGQMALRDECLTRVYIGILIVRRLFLDSRLDSVADRILYRILLSLETFQNRFKDLRVVEIDFQLICQLKSDIYTAASVGPADTYDQVVIFGKTVFQVKCIQLRQLCVDNVAARETGRQTHDFGQNPVVLGHDELPLFLILDGTRHVSDQGNLTSNQVTLRACQHQMSQLIHAALPVTIENTSQRRT